MVGRSSFRNRGGNPATDEAEAAADAGQPVPGSEALAACNAAHSQGGPGNRAPIGGPQGFGLPDLYQDAATGRSDREGERRVSKRNLSRSGELSSSGSIRNGT